MWPALLKVIGPMVAQGLMGGGQQQQDPMAAYRMRMMQGMGQTPQYPQQPVGGGVQQQPQGGMFNQGFGVDRQKWEMMQMLARRLGGGGGGGMGGGY